MEELTNLNHSPKLKELLIMYIARKYEVDAIFNDWHLYQEYVWLNANNLLNELFKEECLTNRLNNHQIMVV
jgi:hypothetical protein